MSIGTYISKTKLYSLKSTKSLMIGMNSCQRASRLRSSMLRTWRGCKVKGTVQEERSTIEGVQTRLKGSSSAHTSSVKSSMALRALLTFISRSSTMAATKLIERR
jgi:hypothetical protein